MSTKVSSRESRPEQQRPGLRGAQEHEPRAGARAELGARVLAGGAQQRDHVGAQGVRGVHAPRGVLGGQQVRGTPDRLHALRAVPGLVVAEHLHLRARGRVTHRDPRHEAVDLRLGQGVGAFELDGVLRGEHDERPGELVGVDVHGDPALLHALEQPGLGLGRRAVDLVDERDVREDRPRPELEALLAAVVDVRPDDVRGQQVGGALDARELEADGAGERAGQRRLADAGQVLDQRVALGEHRDDEIGEDVGAHLGGLRDVGRDAAGEQAGRLELRVRQPPCAVRAIHLAGHRRSRGRPARHLCGLTSRGKRCLLTLEALARCR